MENRKYIKESIKESKQQIKELYPHETISIDLKNYSPSNMNIFEIKIGWDNRFIFQYDINSTLFIELIKNSIKFKAENTKTNIIYSISLDKNPNLKGIERILEILLT